MDILDQLNRITSAGTTITTGTACWGYQFTYDAWGNLLSQAGWSPTYNACTQTNMAGVTADGNNHISGLSYDTSGNTLTDGANTYTWDGESQLKTAAGVTYTYDGDGRRAAKVGTKLYWYGSGGEILSETNASGVTLNDYIFFGGKRVAEVPATGSALFYAEDTLGTSRVIVQSTGTLCYDADFVPFGGEKTLLNTCPQNYKFEGKERDTESGNDDFGARYYSWRFGRWLSSDWSAVPVPVPYANLTNPQTLNLYAMVADDPESFADLDGHLTTPGQEAQTACADNQQCAANEQGQGHSGNLGLARDWLDVIEVSGSFGWSAGVSGQAGSEVKAEGTAGVTTEGTIGLGGGNGEVKVSGAVVNGKVKLGNYEGSVKGGVEVSSKDGVKARASAEVSAGPVKASIAVDNTGVHTNAGAQKQGDVKLGAHAHAGLGVGVNINLSQAKRAFDRSVQSVNALGQYLTQKFMPTGNIF